MFYIKTLLHKMFGTTLEVDLELLANFEYASVQSRPLLGSGKSLVLIRVLIVLIAELMGMFAGLAFPVFYCLCLELLLTHQRSGISLGTLQSPLLLGEMEISSHRQNTEVF